MLPCTLPMYWILRLAQPSLISPGWLGLGNVLIIPSKVMHGIVVLLLSALMFWLWLPFALVGLFLSPNSPLSLCSNCWSHLFTTNRIQSVRLWRHSWAHFDALLYMPFQTTEMFLLTFRMRRLPTIAQFIYFSTGV